MMDPKEIPVGVVGLGLMGTSIVTCLVIAGHPVVAVAPVPADLGTFEKRLYGHLAKAREEGITEMSDETCRQALLVTEDYGALMPCRLVIETTLESLEIKKAVYQKIEAVIAADALVTSNTSAIPISILQRLTLHPERFYGLHWMEPAHTTRFLEVICGEESDRKGGEYLSELSACWGKESTLVLKDIRGFITNRLMYAMYREACSLVDGGYASVRDVDRACRNNPGYWMTLVGVFRWMDLTGVRAYHAVMKDLLPTLNRETDVPRLIDDVVAAGGEGISNGRGFYDYSPQEARVWKEVFRDFSYEIRDLALRYPEDVVAQRLKSEQADNETGSGSNSTSESESKKSH